MMLKSPIIIFLGIVVITMALETHIYYDNHWSIVLFWVCINVFMEWRAR
jgi:hypothetical protein